MDSSRLRRFQDTLADARVRIGRTGFDWYPYDTLANLGRVEQLLSQDLESFLSNVCPNRRILDVGCGEGTAEVRIGRLHVSQMRMVGIDLMIERLMVARRQTAGRYTRTSSCHS